MSSILNSLLSYFTAKIYEEDEKYVIEVPKHEVQQGSLDLDSPHKVAIFGSEEEQAAQSTTPSHEELTPGPSPPVREGEELTVDVVDEGSEGDGIARINEGYVIIIPEGTVGDSLEIEITAVKEQFAIGEQIGAITDEQ